MTVLMPRQEHEEDRTTALGLARYAFEYVEAARLVDEHIGHQPGYEIVAPIPALYLAGHGIELSLKAYLRHHGLSVEQLASRAYGHNLHKCYRKSKELGLHDIYKPSGAEEGALELLNGLYMIKELEYIKTGMKHFPSFALIERMAVSLCNAVGPHVKFPKAFAVAFHGEA